MGNHEHIPNLLRAPKRVVSPEPMGRTLMLMLVVVLLVLLSAAIGALGLVLLRKATQAEPKRPEFSLALLWLLVRHRPVWAAGIGAIVVAFTLQAIALANGPVSMVQLLVVTELPFALVLSRVILGGRLRAREWTATTAMVLGVAVVMTTLAPRGGDPVLTDVFTWVIGLAGTTAVVLFALAAGKRARPAARTALLGVASGVAAGGVAALVKAVTPVLGRGFVALLGTWQAWVLLFAAIAAFFLLQNALQAGRLVASQPGITLANPLAAAVWGIGLFHEQVRTGWWLAGAGLGAALLVAGAVLLSSSPLLAGHREADEEVPEAVNPPGARASVRTSPREA